MAAPNAFAPARYVAAPTPIPHRFGLFSVASVLEPPEADGWGMGVQWERDHCGPATLAGVGCSGQSLFNIPKPTIGPAAFTLGSPFAVYGSWKCSPIGHLADAEQRALNHLYLGEERAVERAIYRGEAGNNALIDASTVDITPTPGTAVSMTAGVALLESYMALNYSGIGMIHANPREVTKMVAAQLISRELSTGTQLMTQLGTYVASEGGMSGLVAPGGGAAAAGSYWMFASGIPQIRRTSAQLLAPVRGSLNTSNNDLTLLAERVYVAAWQCTTVGVLVNDTSGV
jgi:hypothetical protein